MKLSIVTTLYKSAPYIKEFHKRASDAARQLVEEEYEIVFVNDGSPDNSLDLAIQLSVIDDHVLVVDLSRNFGHHRAMMTGLAHAKGERVFLLDSDLEEEPEWLLSFADQMGHNACDVVYGVQEIRKGGWFERLSGFCAYKLFNILCDIEFPDNLVTARLMKQSYVKALLLHQEREIVIAGLWVITGFNQQAQIVNKHATSETTYTFRKKLTAIVNVITSFSNIPLIFTFYIGLSISFFAIIYVAYLVIYRLFLSKPISGWTSVMASIWLMGGLIIFFIGVIGLYIAKIFSETKQRPNTIVRGIYGQSKT